MKIFFNILKKFENSNLVPVSPPSRAEVAYLNKLVHDKLEGVRKGQVEVKKLQGDPTSPLFSVKTFEELRLSAFSRLPSLD